jgi:nicotinate-nucleotide--dimethylbenzimidazole phosphoribosyltransferase
MAVMASLGGLEIAAMTGAMLASAADGALFSLTGSSAAPAALTAAAMAAKLELVPLLDLGFRLGEGTGAAMAMPLVEAGAALLSDMGTLAEELIHLKDPS